VAIWCLLWIGGTALVVFNSSRHPVNEAYAEGARAWAAREPLYPGGGTGFIYPPQAALLHLPFLHLPKALYELAWRGATVGLFAAGVYRLSRCAAWPTEVPQFLLITALILPKTWTLAQNGQATPAMAGLMLWGTTEIAAARWWRATALLFLGLAFKPLAIVLILLAGALYRPLTWRLAVGGVAFLILPGLVADPHYVLKEYLAFVRNLDVAAAVGQQQQMVWPQLFSLLDAIGLGIPIPRQMLVQIVAAAITLAAGWQVRRRFPADQGALLLYSLAACYLLLLNPRTENNSYTLLVPAVAAFIARGILVEKSYRRIILPALILVGVSGGHEICRVLTPQASFIWTCPLACLAFCGYLAVEIAQERGWDRFPLTGIASADIQPGEFPCST
jgi:hypothetical protein